MDQDTCKPILFERVGAIMTFNRPHVMNAIDRALWLQAASALEEFAHDPALRVLILTGAGDRSFCAGTDLKAKAAGEMEMPDEIARWGYAGIVRHYVDKPVIAAVNGFALGGGTEIALSCDLIVASEKATFGLPEIKHGLRRGKSTTAASRLSKAIRTPKKACAPSRRRESRCGRPDRPRRCVK